MRPRRAKATSRRSDDASDPRSRTLGLGGLRVVASMAGVFSLAVALLGSGCVGDDPVFATGVCQPGAKQCLGEVPQICDANGSWHDNGTCTGLTSICNSGVCGSFRLRGGIGTLEAAPALATLRVKESGFELPPRTCGSSLCLRGGLVP